MIASGEGPLAIRSEEGKKGPLLFKSGEAAQRYRHTAPDAHRLRTFFIETPTQAMLLSRIADHLFLQDGETISVMAAEQFALMFEMRDGQNWHRNRR